MIEPNVLDRGIKDLYRTTEPDGVFVIRSFKALGKKQDGRSLT